jgi:hypothetical protein
MYIIKNTHTSKTSSNFIFDYMKIERRKNERIKRSTWEELMAYSPLIRHGPHRKQRLQQLFVAAETSLPSRCIATIRGYAQKDPQTPHWYDRPHRKRRAQQFFHSCVCICCRGNVCTEPSNIHIQTHRLMGGIYEVRRLDGMRCHDIHTISKNEFRHSKVNRGNSQTERRSHKPTSGK